MGARREFVRLALAAGANRRALCRRFGISPTTGYHWIAQFLERGDDGLTDRSRRPKHSPHRTAPSIEQLVLRVRDEHPRWGAPKIAHILERDHGVHRSQSTIHAILRRHGRIDPAASLASTAWQRFEKPAPNELWQMDFKGHFAAGDGRCYPLTILDDHSRYSLALRACSNEQFSTVQPALTDVFRRYGLPAAMLMDNGNPWGNASAGHPYTKLTVWMIRLGIVPLHARPLHPQTLGKEERFHRTLKAELLGTRWFASQQLVQDAFDRWREVYNHERPHAALGMAVPADRYVMSTRAFPEQLPPIEYGADDLVRRVNTNGSIRLHGRFIFFCEGFAGEPVALRPTMDDGRLAIYYCHERVGEVDLSTGTAHCGR